MDSEPPRFLEFEKWWGSPVLLNAEEMQTIADQLFVGNKLSCGELRSCNGLRLDLRNITSPIIVFCSWGDDITPPQQALHWILDLYDDEDEIVAAGQKIPNWFRAITCSLSRPARSMTSAISAAQPRGRSRLCDRCPGFRNQSRRLPYRHSAGNVRRAPPELGRDKAA